MWLSLDFLFSPLWFNSVFHNMVSRAEFDPSMEIFGIFLALRHWFFRLQLLFSGGYLFFLKFWLFSFFFAIFTLIYSLNSWNLLRSLILMLYHISILSHCILIATITSIGMHRFFPPFVLIALKDFYLAPHLSQLNLFILLLHLLQSLIRIISIGCVMISFY